MDFLVMSPTYRSPVFDHIEEITCPAELVMRSRLCCIPATRHATNDVSRVFAPFALEARVLAEIG